MTEPNYANTIQRILDILQADTEFAEKIAEFRFGDLPQVPDGTNFPLCFISTAQTPEISRTIITPQSNVNLLPGQRIKLEFWVIIVVTKQSTPGDVQHELYELSAMVQNILAKNNQLRDTAGENPLCMTSEIFTQGRLEQKKGQLLEAMTIRVRPTIVTVTTE